MITMGLDWIYFLVDPRSGEVRYVGFSTNPVARLKEHLKCLHRTHCSRWVSQLKSSGYKPVMVLLEPCSRETWQDAERKWIVRMRQEGARLTNHTDGGEGIPGYKFTPEQKEKMRTSHLGGPGFRGPHTEETRRKIKAARALQTNTNAGMKRTPETIERIRQAKLGTKMSEATKQKMSESAKRGWVKRRANNNGP